MTLAAHTKVDECSIAGPMSQNLDEPVSRPAAAAVVAASMGGKAGRGCSRSFQHGCHLLLERLASWGIMNEVVGVGVVSHVHQGCLDLGGTFS